MWTALILIIISAAGTRILRRSHTPLAIGGLLGVTFIGCQQMLIIFAIFVERSHSATDPNSAKALMQRAMAIFSFFVFIVWGIFGILLAVYRSDVIKDVSREGLAIRQLESQFGNFPDSFPLITEHVIVKDHMYLLDHLLDKIPNSYCPLSSIINTTGFDSKLNSRRLKYSIIEEGLTVFDFLNLKEISRPKYMLYTSTDTGTQDYNDNDKHLEALVYVGLDATPYYMCHQTIGYYGLPGSRYYTEWGGVSGSLVSHWSMLSIDREYYAFSKSCTTSSSS